MFKEINWKKVKVISFDVGNTLVYDTKEEYEIYYEILKEMKFKISKEKCKKALEKSKKKWKKENKYKIWNIRSLKTVIKEMLKYLKIKSDNKILKNIIKKRIEKRKKYIKIYNDVKKTLEKLKEKNFKLIIISNATSKKYTLKYLLHLNLKNYFEKVFVSGSLGFEKPSPEIFNISISKLKIKKDEIVHVGNDYERDYLGAEKIGIKAILIDRNRKYEKINCRKIEKLTELLKIIDD